MIALSAALIVLSCLAGVDAPQWVTYPGAGKTIVLVSGDEEYRSEEALPQLGRILSVRHGFACHVLFAIDPATGEIDPDIRNNIPGLALLDDADLMIIATRFRDLPDDQMSHIDAYLASGRPVVGLRTATHAFAIEASDTFQRYTWNYGGPEFTQGFGRQVLGETWIAHHGQHGVESTRGVLAPGVETHPITSGITAGDVWGPTDVYRVRLPLPDGCTPIVLGQVLAGMGFDDVPVTGGKNDPMMPIAWTKTHDGSGFGPRRVFTTTMGAATDLAAAGTRRMIVNGVYWALGMDDVIPEDGADVRIVGVYEPSGFGFGGFRRDVRPRDHAMPGSSKGMLAPGTRLVVVGNTFAERLAQSGVFDAVAHAAHPGHRLVIRHVPWSGDEVTLRPREKNVPTMLEWIDRLDADVVMLCFGMSESFTQTPEQYELGLRELIERIASPRVILVSPIGHEGDAAHNESLADITDVMRRVADEKALSFVDLYAVSLDAYDRERRALTTNGIHPTEQALAIYTEAIAAQLGWLDVGSEGKVSADAAESVDALRSLAADQYWLFRLLYRPTNTEYVWGRRHDPYGVVNFPPEMAQLQSMMAARDRAIWQSRLPSPADVIARARVAPPVWPTVPTDRVFPEDAWTPVPVEARGTETSLGELNIKSPDSFAQSFTLPDDYVIECFASERDFAELANPLAMTFDDRGRLWVLCTPTYPHLLPGERPRCTLLILEDTDKDGRADRRTVFADGLYIPTGFAIGADSVYLGQAPDLLRLVDTDGDDRADTTEILFSGFGMCDSHHQISAFEWDPAGGLLMHEGVFTKSNVETPDGTRRTDGAGVWRYDPRTGRLEILSHCYFNNPWGHVHDDFGAGILADASGGDNYSFTHASVPFEYPHKPKNSPRISNRGRPTAGCEIIASRHFPDDVQGSFLVNQSIGFHGTRWDRLTIAGSTWVTESMPADLLSSTDVNFRPVAMEIGPDGALYILDWCNPIVGHMQYSVRDPRRDHAHGRVWRVRHRTRELVEPVNVHDATVAQLLDYLRLPERNTRDRARRRLQRMPWATVRPALIRWQLTLDPTDPLYARLKLEDLWIRHAHGRANALVIERVLALDEPRARAGAVRVLRHQVRAGEIDGSAAMRLVAPAVDDPDMRVRLEGVVTCGYLPGADGVRLAARADLQDMDEAMQVVFEEVLAYLGRGGDVVSDVLDRVRMTRMPADELLVLPLDETSAIARLSRTDVPREPRLEALAFLAGADPSEQAARLVSLLDALRGEAVLRSLGVMLLSMPEEVLDGLADAARSMAGDADPARRSVGIALQLGQDKPVTGDLNDVVAALAMMETGRAPQRTLSDVEAAVSSGDVDPGTAIEQVVRHHPDQERVRAWLAVLAEGAAGEPIVRWSVNHERAMAAQRVMSGLPAWPELEPYRVEAATVHALAEGRALYHDEVRGCVRCHGPRGRGLEGYPPLDRSPWVLGAPGRAAGIVVHGLYGRLEMPDGSEFNSAMEPIGDLLEDEQIASVLTYVRQSWGNFVQPVLASDVAAARTVGPEFGGMWEVGALARAYPLRRDTLVATPVASGRVGLLRTLALVVGLPLIFVVLIIVVLERRGAGHPAR